nr:hypothetical protein [Tanacetum cinerariifolium]
MGKVDINTLSMEQYLALTCENQAPSSCFMYSLSHSLELRRDGWTDYLHEQPTREISVKGIAHHQKRKVSNGSSDGIAAIANKLDSLRRDMKKLKENVHAIQLGCETYGRAHLDKECPLHEDVKSIEEVKYGEFVRSFPNNSINGARYRVGPQDTIYE